MMTNRPTKKRTVKAELPNALFPFLPTARRTALALALGACFLSTHAAYAANGADTYVGGGGNNNLSTAANFTAGSANKPPVSGDSITFGNTTTGTNTVNDDLANAFNLNGLTFSAGTLADTISGNSFNLTNNITNSSTNLQTILDAIALTATRTVTMTTGGGNVTLGGVISGTGFGLTTAGAGTLTLSGANTFSGTTTTGAGTTLDIANAMALQSSTTAFNAGAVTFDSAGGTAFTVGALGGAVNLALTNTAAAPIALTAGGNNASTTYSGIISGAGSLNKVGTGSMVLGTANSFTGGLNIKSGTVGGSNNATSFGATGNTITIGDSTVGLNAALNIANGSLTYVNQPIIIAAGAGTRSITGTFGNGNAVLNDAVTLNNNLILSPGGAGNGALNITGGFTGTGNLTLNATSTSGILLSGSSVNNVGTITNSSTGTASLNSITISSVIGTNVTGVTQNSTTAALILSGANTYTGPTMITAGKLQIGNAGTTGSLAAGSAITDNGTLIFNRTDTGLVVANTITGSGGLTQAGAGTTTLTTAAGNTGTTLISAGTLALGTGGNLGTGAVTDNATLASTGTDTKTVGDTISGTGVVTQSGTGTTTLSGPNTYSGITTISAGKLIGTNTSAFGSGANAANQLNLTAAAATLSLLNDGTGSNQTIIYGGTTASNNGYNLTAGSGTVNVGNNGGGSTNNTIQLGTFTFGSGSGTVNVTGSNGYNLGFSGGLTTPGANNITLNTNTGVTFAGGLTSGAGKVSTFAGTGTTTINGNLASTTPGTGYTIVVGGTTGGGFTGNLALKGTAAADDTSATVDGGSLTLYNAGSLGSATPITLQNANGTTLNTATVNLRNDANTTYGNNVTDSATNTTFSVDQATAAGTGNTLTLGTLGLTGNPGQTVTVTNGNSDNLAFGAASDTYNPTINNNMVNGTTTLASYNDTATSGTQTLAFGGTSATAGTTVTGAITQAAGGTLKVTQNGADTLTLSGANTYTGATTVSNGTLAVNGSTAASAVSVGSAGTLTGTGTVGGAVADSGTINAGTVGTVGTLNTGALTLAGGSTLGFDAGGGTADLLNITGLLSASGTVNVMGNVLSPLTAASYELAGFTGLGSGTTLSNFNLTGAGLSGYHLAFNSATAPTMLDLIMNSTVTNGQYTLAATAGATNLRAGSGTTTVTNTLTNTGTAPQDSLNYTGVTDTVAPTANGTVSGLVGSGTNLAPGASVTPTQTFTAGTGTGTTTITPTGTVTNANLTGSTPTGTITGTTLNVYSGSETYVGPTAAAGSNYVIPGTTNATVQTQFSQGGAPGIDSAFTGQDATTINNGTAVNLNASPNLASLTLGGGSSLTAGGGTLTLDGTNASNSGGTNGTATVTTDGTATSIAAPVVLATGTTATVAGGTLTVSGAVSGTGGLTKAGAGGLVIMSANNTYSGGTTVSAGTLNLGAAAADGTGPVTIAGGGTVTLNTTTTGAGTNNGSALGAGGVVLSGGTLLNGRTGATSAAGDGSGTNDFQNGGLLTLTDGTTSIIDFGAGNTGGVFSFTGLSGNGLLQIDNFNGNFFDGTNGGDGADQLIFESGANNNTPVLLTTGQLAQITFINPDGAGGNATALQLSDGEVSPAPEPSQVGMMGLMAFGLGGLVLRARKRQAAKAGAAA